MQDGSTLSNSPHFPIHPDGDRLARLRLLRSRRVGIATYNRLIAEHGSASAALDALPDVAAAAGVKNYETFSEKAALDELRAGEAMGAALVLPSDPAFPDALHDLSDAPPMLWMRGSSDLLRRPCVALVGARNASSLGTRMARKLAADLAEAGITIVSGLARGVDTAAHLGALKGGTAAVFAGGLDCVYPPQNLQLAGDIARGGVVLTEAPPGTTPKAGHFPERNRIVSGLSRAVVVIEAAARSGSFITARNALDQGRDVLAVPGHPFDARAAGCNMLLRDGATLVRGAQDVLETLATPAPTDSPVTPTTQAPPRKPSAKTGALPATILNALGPSPVAEDQLIRDLQLPAQDVGAVLTELELDGKLQRHPGGLLSLA